MPGQPAFRRSPALPRGFAFLPRFQPVGIIRGEAAAAAVIAGHGWSLAGTDAAFTAMAVMWADRGQHWLAVAPFAELVEWAESESPDLARQLGRVVRRMGRPRAPWAGLGLDRPRIMGIINATPDSFSDGGRHLETEQAVQAAIAMMEAGADLIDVGGESTRPGALAVGEDEEIRRTQPVVRALANQGITVSIDTRHAQVMQAALEAGAKVINDVTALTGPGALAVAAKSDAALCLMHMQGEPGSMQANPCYECAPFEVMAFLEDRLAAVQAAGIGAERVAVDPGIGFGKTASHNAQLLVHLGLLHGLGCPILLGASRKSLIGAFSQGEGAANRLAGTIAIHQMGLDAGVQILRVHDVPQAAQALACWRAVGRV